MVRREGHRHAAAHALAWHAQERWAGPHLRLRLRLLLSLLLLRRHRLDHRSLRRQRILHRPRHLRRRCELRRHTQHWTRRQHGRRLRVGHRRLEGHAAELCCESVALLRIPIDAKRADWFVSGLSMVSASTSTSTHTPHQSHSTTLTYVPAAYRRLTQTPTELVSTSWHPSIHFRGFISDRCHRKSSVGPDCPEQSGPKP